MPIRDSLLILLPSLSQLTARCCRNNGNGSCGSKQLLLTLAALTCLAQLPAPSCALNLDRVQGQPLPQAARDLGHFKERKRGEDESYIRFGKRDSETLLPQAQYKSLFEPSVKRAAEQSYIRFGKRNGGLTPCTLQFLRALPSKQSRLQHVKDCSINRQTRDARSEEEGYIRFGKRSSSSPLPKREAAKVILGSGAMQVYFDATTNKCYFIFNPESENTIVRDCSATIGDDSSPGMLLEFPEL